MKEFVVGIDLEVYSIYDRKTSEYSGLVASPNLATYKRSIYADVVDLNPRNKLRTFAGDYDVYKIGRFNVKTGEFVPEREFVISVEDLKNEFLSEDR